MYLREYSETHHKPRSRERHVSSSKHLVPFLGDKLLKEITPEVIQKYIAQRRNEKASNGTINRELALLKHCFSIAIKWGWAIENPVKRIEMLREPRGRVRYLKPEERERLFATLPWYIKPIVVFAMHTGMRKAEILNLQWSQVSLQNRSVILEDTKNNERRSVPLNDTVMAVLREVGKIRRLDVPYVFFNPITGDRWVDVQHAFLRACKAAGIEDFRFHDLRHTAASYLVMAGVNLATVKEILGHKTIEMTLRYAHLSPAHTLAAAKELDRAFEVAEQARETLSVGTNWAQSGLMKSNPIFENLPTHENYVEKLAGATGVEPATPGFGDRCSAS